MLHRRWCKPARRWRPLPISMTFTYRLPQSHVTMHLPWAAGSLRDTRYEERPCSDVACNRQISLVTPATFDMCLAACLVTLSYVHARGTKGLVTLCRWQGQRTQGQATRSGRPNRQAGSHGPPMLMNPPISCTSSCICPTLECKGGVLHITT